MKINGVDLINFVMGVNVQEAMGCPAVKDRTGEVRT